MLIRPARVTDVGGLVPLFDQWGHGQPADAITAQLAEWEQTPRADVLVADADGAVVGVVAVTASPHVGRPGREARVKALVVASTHRRQGVGAALLRAAEQRAREWGCDQVDLTSARSRDAAHSFYLSHGYTDQCEHHARYLRRL